MQFLHTNTHPLIYGTVTPAISILVQDKRKAGVPNINAARTIVMKPASLRPLNLAK